MQCLWRDTVELGLRVTILLPGNSQHPSSQKREISLTDTQTNISVQVFPSQARCKANKQWEFLLRELMQVLNEMSFSLGVKVLLIFTRSSKSYVLLWSYFHFSSLIFSVVLGHNLGSFPNLPWKSCWAPYQLHNVNTQCITYTLVAGQLSF